MSVFNRPLLYLYGALMKRLESLTPDRLTVQQSEVREAILASRSDPGGVVAADGSLLGPFNAMVHSPMIGAKLGGLGHAVRFENSLEPRLLELAITIVGAHWKSEFEFWAHSRIALAKGIDAHVVDALAAGVIPHFARDDERAIYEAVTSLLTTGKIDDATWQGLTFCSPQQRVDLVHTVGYYCLISLSLNAFEVPLPAGQPERFLSE